MSPDYVKDVVLEMLRTETEPVRWANIWELAREVMRPKPVLTFAQRRMLADKLGCFPADIGKMLTRRDPPQD
jgi:hypothetical protein